MLFGSFIAGATSEGGGAIAFPVMTLFFKLTPALARDYTFIIQSFGMSSASLFILSRNIKIESKIIPWVLIGAITGCALGLTYLEGIFPPAMIKLFFVTLWMCFAIKLIIKSEQKPKVPPHKITLILIGLIGGAVTSMIGSGVDIITFSLLSIVYGYDEKILTPTSVILMSVTSIFGSVWKIFILNSFSPQAYEYWWVTVPICILGAPLGAYAINFFSSQKIVKFLVFSICIQFICALVILKLSSMAMAISILCPLLMLVTLLIIKKRTS